MALDRVLHGGHKPRTVAEVEAERIKRFIDAAPSLLEIAKLFAKSIEYEIRKSAKEGDDEGARLKTLTLNLVLAAIAKATAPCLALMMLFSLAALNGCVALDEGLIILSDIIDRSDAAQKDFTNVQP